jgi:hypothetical protein
MDAETRALETRTVAGPSAAVAGSPFLDATLGGLFLDERYSDPIVFGLQAGAYLGEAVRLMGRVEMPSTEAKDNASYPPNLTGNAFPQQSPSPALLYGGALGLVAIGGQNFVFSPGLTFLRANVSDYGTFLGVTLPFEWVTTRALRFGFAVDVGRAFGGTVHNGCGGGACATVDTDRQAGRGIALRFSMGYGFGGRSHRP